LGGFSAREGLSGKFIKGGNLEGEFRKKFKG
jgi:hypothetical protein